MTARLVIAADIDELAATAAAMVRDAALEAVTTRGLFRLVLSGGETPRALFSRLASDTAYRDMPWNRTQVFWGDERHVPPDHPDSNYRMAWETLLRHVPIPTAQVFRMRGEDPDPARAANEYEAAIRTACGLAPHEWPRFDLVLLGIGADGHTASLFPGRPTLDEHTRLTAVARVDARQSVRVTMTLPVLNHAARVAFMVAGASKAEAVAAALHPRGDTDPVPAALVHPIDGELIWMLDSAAAALAQSES